MASGKKEWSQLPSKMRRIMSSRMVSKFLVLLFICSCVAASTDDTSTTTTAAPTTVKPGKGSSESESSLVETAVQLDGQETRPRSYTYSKQEAGYGQPDYGQLPEEEPTYGKREKPPSYYFQGRNGGSYQPKSIDNYQQYEQRDIGDYSQGSKSSGNKYTQQQVDVAYNQDKYDSPNYEYEEPQKQQYPQSENYGTQTGIEPEGGEIYQSKIPDQNYDSNYEHQGGEIYQSKIPEIESHYGSQGKDYQSIRQEEENPSSYGSQEGHISPSHSNYGSPKGTAYGSSSVSEGDSSYGSPKVYQTYSTGNGHSSEGNSYQSAEISEAGHSSYGSPNGYQSVSGNSKSSYGSSKEQTYPSQVSNIGHSSYGSPKGSEYQSGVSGSSYSSHGSPKGTTYQSEVSGHSGYGSPKGTAYQTEVSGHSGYGSPKGSEYQSGVSGSNYPSHGSPKGTAYQSEVSGHSGYASPKGSEYQSGISGSSYSSHGSPKGTAYQSKVSGHSGYGSPKGIAYETEVSGHSGYGSPKGSEYQSDVSGQSFSSHGSPKGTAYQSEVSGHSGYESPKGSEYQSGVSGSSYSSHGSPKGTAYQSEVSGHSGYGSPKGSEYKQGVSGSSYSSHGSPKGTAYQSEVSGHSAYGTPKGSEYKQGVSGSSYSSHGSPKGTTYQSEISGHSSYGPSKGSSYNSGNSDEDNSNYESPKGYQTGISSHSSYGGSNGKSYESNGHGDGYSSIASNDGKGYHTTHQIIGGHGNYGSGKGKSTEANVAEVTSYFHLGSSKGYRSFPVQQHESGDYSQRGNGYSSGVKSSQFPAYSKEPVHVQEEYKQPEYLQEDEKAPAYQKEAGYQSPISTYEPSLGKGYSGGKTGRNMAVFIKQLGHSPDGDKHGSKNGERHGYLLLPVSAGHPEDKIKITTTGLNSGIKIQPNSPLYSTKPVYESTGKESYAHSGIEVPAQSSKAFISGHFSGESGHKSSGQGVYTVQANKGGNEYSTVAESPKTIRYSKPVIAHTVPTSSYKGSQGYGANQGVTVLKPVAGGYSDTAQYVQDDGYGQQTQYVVHQGVSNSQGHGSKGSYGQGKSVVELPLSHTLSSKGIYGTENKQYTQVPVLSFGGVHSIVQGQGKIVQAHEYEAKQPLGYSSSSDYSLQKQVDVKGKDFPPKSYSSFTPIINPYASVVDFSAPKGRNHGGKALVSQGYNGGYGSTKTVVAAEKPKSLAIILQKIQDPVGSRVYSSSSPHSVKTAKANPSYGGFRPILPQTGHKGRNLGYSTFHTYTGLASNPYAQYKKPSLKS